MDMESKPKQEKIKATIYATGEFMGGINKIECYLLKHEHQKYAQYDKAVYIEFIPKGKRKARYFLTGHEPFYLILKGWNLPNPEDSFKIQSSSNGTIVKKSKYCSHDKRYRTEFNALINPLLKDFEIIHDYRHTTKENNQDEELNEICGYKKGDRIGLAISGDNYKYGILKKIIIKASGKQHVEVLCEDTQKIEFFGTGFIMAKSCL